MSPYDEDLQNEIEAGLHADGGDADAEAYRRVFRTLGRPLAFRLPRGFADRVLLRIEKRRKRESSRDLLWLGFGIFLLVLSFIVALVMTGFTGTLGFLRDVSPYSGVFVFGLTFIVFLNWLDKRLLRMGDA